MTTEKQFSRSVNKGKAPLSLGTSSTLPVSPREAVARWNGNTTAAESTGEVPMVVGGQAELLPAGDEPKISDGNNVDGVPNINNSNNDHDQRPLKESDAKAEEAEAERKQLEAAWVLTKTKLRAIFGASFGELQGSLLSVIEFVDRYEKEDTGCANAAAGIATTTIADTAAGIATTTIADTAAGIRAAAIGKCRPLIIKMGHAAIRSVSACAIASAASRAVADALKKEMITSVSEHRKRDEFFVENLVRPAVADIGYAVGQSTLQASMLSLGELKRGVMSRTGEDIDRYAGGEPLQLDAPSFVPTALLRQLEALDDKLRARLAELPALSREFEDAFRDRGNAATRLVGAACAVSDRTPLGVNVFELFGDLDLSLVKGLVDAAGVAAAVAAKRVDAIFDALTTSIELHRVKDARDRALKKSLRDVAASPKNADAAAVAALLSKFDAAIVAKLDAAEAAAAAVAAAAVAGSPSEKRGRTSSQAMDDEAPSPAAVAAAAAAKAVAASDASIAATMGIDGRWPELATLMELEGSQLAKQVLACGGGGGSAAAVGNGRGDSRGGLFHRDGRRVSDGSAADANAGAPTAANPAASAADPNHEPLFAIWPPPSRVRPSREQIIEKLRSVPPPPVRLAPDDVADADLADDHWRKRDMDLDSEAFARDLENFGKPLARIPIVIASLQSSTVSLERRTDADIEGLARRMREYLGPPIGRPAEDHRAYTAFMEACPPRPGVVPGLLASADKRGPSVADRKCKAAIDRVRAERDAAARAVREAEEKAAAEPAAASAAHR